MGCFCETVALGCKPSRSRIATVIRIDKVGGRQPRQADRLLRQRPLRAGKTASLDAPRRGQLEAACRVLASVRRAWGGVVRAAGRGSVAGDTQTDGTVRNRTAAELVGPDEICRVLVGERVETARGPVRQRPTRRSGKAESEQRVVLVGETR